jgi:hypothetical protein
MTKRDCNDGAGMDPYYLFAFPASLWSSRLHGRLLHNVPYMHPSIFAFFSAA